MARLQIKSERQLVEHILELLSDKWRIEVYESRREEWSPILGMYPQHYWACCVSLMEPVHLNVYLNAKSLAGLVQEVQRKLMDEIRKELLAAYPTGHPEGFIDSQGKRVGVKHLALTHQQ